MSDVAHPTWPLFDLRIATPRIELRYPSDDMLSELASVAAAGVHDPDRMPFIEPWTRRPPGELEVKALQYWWTSRANLRAEEWTITFAVLDEGRPVGVQEVLAKDFPICRAFETKSWLGVDHHGRGIGSEMRAAALYFGFEGLGADRAFTGCFVDNPESQAVTRKLGYEQTGRWVAARDGHPVEGLGFTLLRSTWERRRRNDIGMHGVSGCLPLLGLA